jgi:hypothetical protein
VWPSLREWLDRRDYCLEQLKEQHYKGTPTKLKGFEVNIFFAAGLIVTSLASAALQPPQQASAQAESSVQAESQERDELRLDGMPDPEHLKDRRGRHKDE